MRENIEIINNFNFKNIENYSKVVSYLLNESISNKLFKAVLNVSILNLYDGLNDWIYKLGDNYQKNIQNIINKYFSNNEYNELKNKIDNDATIRTNIKTIKITRQLSNITKKISIGSQDLNKLKNIGINFYNKNHVKTSIKNINNRIKEILPDILYNKYKKCDEEFFNYCGQHMFY